MINFALEKWFREKKYEFMTFSAVFIVYFCRFLGNRLKISPFNMHEILWYSISNRLLAYLKTFEVL